MTVETVKTDKDIRGIVTWAIGALIALVGIFAGVAFHDLTKSIDGSVARIESLVATVNQHSTTLALLEQKNTDLDRRVIKLEVVTEQMRLVAPQGRGP